MMIYNFDNLTFQILAMNRYIQSRGIYYVKPRPYSTLTFRLSGLSELKTENKSFQLCPGDFLFFPENIPYTAAYHDDVEMIYVHFADCNYIVPEKITVENIAYFQKEFINLFNDWSSERSANRIKSGVYNLLYMIDREKKQSSADREFNLAINFIRNNFNSADLSVPEICKNAGLSESTLRRKFENNLGISPKQYLLKVRLDYAISLLSKGDISVREVAGLCGFSDEKYFSRAVKSRFGRSPAEFKP